MTSKEKREKQSDGHHLIQKNRGKSHHSDTQM